MRAAVHVGPHPYTVGGTQSVLRTVADFSIGADRVRLLPTWSGHGMRSDIRLVARAAGAIARTDRDTVTHVHISNGGAWIRDGILVRWASWLRRPVVVSIHGDDFPKFSARHPRAVAAVLSAADQITCLSEEANRAIESVVGAENVTVLPNPVAIDYEAPPAETTAPVVLFAGAVGRRKGADILIQAWRRLVEKGVPGECRIVGPLDDLTPPSVERLTIDGPAHPDVIRPLIRAARVVALPSRSEGMPMILTEALASGRPFVATPVGGTVQLAPFPEMLVPTEDPAALALALESFLSDPQLAGTIGKAGQQFCIDTRSPAVVDQKLREIYERI